MSAPAPALDLPDGLDVGALVDLAESAARAAGDLVEKDRPARVEVADTKSSPTDVVTAMDRASEDLLRAWISRVRPDDALLGEEAGMDSGRSGVTWVVDPIDGTVNYLYGIPLYCVSVAAVLGDPRTPGAWRPVAGCVHNPASGQTWTAGAGQGAWLDGVRQVAPEPPALAEALVGTGFGYQAQRRREQARVAAGLLPAVRDLRRLGSAAVDLCLVASGRLDAFYERGLNPWDIAAGMLVAREAGVEVVGLGCAPPSGDMVVAARAPLVGTLADTLTALGA